MVSKEQKKIERVINFMKKGLTSLADDLGETVKGVNDFIKSLAKAQKDLKEITVGEEVQTVSSSSTKIVAPTTGSARTAAASTLFSLLSGSGDGQAPGVPATTTAPMSAPPAPPTASSGPPSAPPTGPPKAPGSPPSAPPSGPPQKGNLPSPPKLPPSGPPKAPVGPPQAGSPPKAPAFAKRPAAPPAGPPKAPGPAAPVAAPQAGGGLSSLRDEMLDELNRLKKIMRGE